MDKYEKLLEEKIENAKNDLSSACLAVERYAARYEICAYQDAITTYRNLKAKGEI